MSSQARPSSSSSSRSLPAYPNGQLPIPPYPTTRRRPATARALRSSPLAGPLSGDEATHDSSTSNGEKPKYRPSRISSTPDLTAATAARSRYPSLADTSNLPTYSPVSVDSSAIVTESSRPHSTISLNSSSTSIQSISFPKFDPLPTPTSDRDLKPPFVPHNHSRPPSVSRDPRENWLSTTDPIPRFSRLGLGGEGVVMPVSAKSHSYPKHTSRSDSFSSQTSTILPRPDSTGSISRSSLFVQVGAVPKYSDADFGALGGALDERRRPFVKDEKHDGRQGKIANKWGLVMRITDLVKKDPSPTKKLKKRHVSGDDPARQTGRPTEQQKKVGGFRKKWNEVVASIRR